LTIPPKDNHFLIQTIFDYLAASTAPFLRGKQQIRTKPGECSPLLQLLDMNTFWGIEDLHEHTTWVTDETMQHFYSRARFIAAYNLITGGEPDDEHRKLSG